MPAQLAEAPTAPSRTFEDICRLVRSRIAEGKLRPGDKLPAEREMAEQLGVGRNAVREAFRSLEIGGVIELKKGRSGGAFILPPDAKRLTFAIQDLHDMGSVGLDELMEARILVAEQIVRLAAERATEQHFDDLDADIDLLEALTREGRLDERSMRATHFFHLIALATGNRALVLLDSSLADIIRRFVGMALKTGKPQLPNLIDWRRRFMAQLRNRNAEQACAELRGQLLDLQRTLSKLIPAKSTAPVSAKSTRRRATARSAKGA